MYASFIIYNNYALAYYAFHKFDSAFLFAAYSITIYDWSYVLRDIEKDTISPFMTRKMKSIYLLSDATLIIINIIFWGISIANFIDLFIINNLDIYLSSYLYLIAIFIQIIASLVIIGLMLHSGWKLGVRITGVTVNLDSNQFANNHQLNNTQSLSISHPGVSSEFQKALFSLNIVMFVCFICVAIQMILLTLNYALGYANQSGVYVGPFYFYW